MTTGALKEGVAATARGHAANQRWMCWCLASSHIWGMRGSSSVQPALDALVSCLISHLGFEQAADVNLRPIEQRWMRWYRLTFVVCVLRAGGGLLLLYYSRA